MCSSITGFPYRYVGVFTGNRFFGSFSLGNRKTDFKKWVFGCEKPKKKNTEKNYFRFSVHNPVYSSTRREHEYRVPIPYFMLVRIIGMEVLRRATYWYIYELISYMVERELAAFDENRRAVGMLNPMRDKN